jgi:hypothetical protein
MWHALGDACPECQNLNGRTWTGQDIFQDILWDPIWGNIWDMNIDMPLTHGGTGAHCRCQLEVQAHFDWSKLEETGQLSNVLNMEEPASNSESFDYISSDSRTTTFEDIGVV